MMDEVREVRHFHFFSEMEGSTKVSFTGRTPKAASGHDLPFEMPSRFLSLDFAR